MIMDCKRCKEDLSAYLDAELSPADYAEMQSHLEACMSCTEELHSFQKTADFFETHTGELELPPGSWNLVKARISMADSPSPSRFPGINRWRYAFAALVFFIALGAGYLWHQQAEQKSLDEYIAQYVKARDAGQIFRFKIGGAKAGFNAANFKTGNPFIEVKATIDVNPFRSEDR